MNEITARLTSVVGDKGFSEDPAEIAPHLEEWRSKYEGRTALLLKPSTTAEISALLAICHETVTPIVPQGGNTGLVGAQIPYHGEILLTLKRMNKVRALDAEGMVLTAEAGLTLAAAQNAAAAQNLLFPLTLASEGSCTIGGNISTNAGGNHVLRYGMMRSLVMGLEVVLADGRVLPMLKSLHKDNTGYDLKQIFIGAEGTLGIVTAATLRLFARPAETAVAFAAVANPSAALALLGLMQAKTGSQLSAFELLSRLGFELVQKHVPGIRDPLEAPSPWYVLLEVAGGEGATELASEALGAALEQEIVSDVALAQNEAHARAFWQIREGLSEGQKREGASIKHDISVPVGAIPAFIEKATAAVKVKFPDARPVTFGHMGDGNLHFNFSAPAGGQNDAAFLAEWDEMQLTVHDIVKEFSGSISAEHGIGVMKRDLLPRYKSSEELDAMRALKHAFDPKNILNPGKTVPAVKRL
jgi:FAD/FMN-containing dehydrogenase